MGRWLGGWVGGRTLIIKLTSAQLRYAANGAVAELGNKKLFQSQQGKYDMMEAILGHFCQIKLV